MSSLFASLFRRLKLVHISQLSFEYLRETGIEPDSPASVRCATHSQPSIHRSHHVRNVHAGASRCHFTDTYSKYAFSSGRPD
jgi:hypothetical protein